MKPFEKLIQRIRDECGIPISEHAVGRRLYPGRHQRAAGAFLWIIKCPHVIELAGYEPVKHMLKYARLFKGHRPWYETAIIIEGDDQKTEKSTK